MLFQAFVRYESMLERIVDAVDPLLDSRPMKIDTWMSGSLKQKYSDWPQLRSLLMSGTVEAWRWFFTPLLLLLSSPSAH